jgi:hypothetical protein
MAKGPKGYIIKAVVFNPNDPEQQRLIEHSDQRTNFSSYIKRLIQRDMEGGSVKFVAAVYEDSSSAPRDFDEKGFI